MFMKKPNRFCSRLVVVFQGKRRVMYFHSIGDNEKAPQAWPFSQNIHFPYTASSHICLGYHSCCTISALFYLSGEARLPKQTRGRYRKCNKGIVKGTVQVKVEEQDSRKHRQQWQQKEKEDNRKNKKQLGETRHRHNNSKN